MHKTVCRVSLVAGLLLAALLACAKAPAADTRRAELEAAIQRWITAVNAHDAPALSATMTDDVELLDHSSTVTGRDAASRVLLDLAARGRLVQMTREITIDDDVAWHVVGVAQARKNGVVQARGQALEIWKRANGEWRLQRRMTADAAPEIPVTRPSTDEPVLDRPPN